MTFMAGNSIQGAAKLALEKWKTEERPAIATYKYVPPATTPYDHETGECYPNFAYGYAAEAVQVEIRKSTGEMTFKRVICADDVGKAINPQQVRGQIEGALIQAMGYAAMEKFIQKDGLVMTKGLSTYLLPTIKDIPEQTITLIVEDADPLGPSGARGIGELPYLAFAAAYVMQCTLLPASGMMNFRFTQEVILRVWLICKHSFAVVLAAEDHPSGQAKQLIPWRGQHLLNYTIAEREKSGITDILLGLGASAKETRPKQQLIMKEMCA